MRITFVSPSLNMGGGTRVLALHARYLMDLGHDVLVVCAKPHRRSIRERLRLLLDEGVSSLKSTPQFSHFEGVSVPVEIARSDYVAPSEVPDADVVIATWWETAEWIADFPAAKGAKVYFIQGYETFPGQPADRVRATWRLPFEKITISTFLQEIGEHEFNQHGMYLVPNAVDHLQFTAPPRHKQNRPTIGYVYSGSSVKGPDVILAAVEELRESFPDLRIVSFGSSEPSAEFPLPSESEFSLRPPQSKLKHLYAQCDAWLCGSRSEGFALPVLEAMACRTIPVTTRVGGPPDYIDNGKDGFLVDIEDAHGLAEKAADVLRMDDEAWRTISDAAFQKASMYDWSKSSKLFEAALMEIVGK